ncbi:MAG TPA: 4-alpha-glucanotransferase [Coleofasciculaceae cyanobacterium]
MSSHSEATSISRRASGILLHPTSLPGAFGAGDLGPEAYRFIDFLRATGQQIWQVLPLGPTGYGNSPYMCYSAMAGNPLLISLERLRDSGLLTNEELASFPRFDGDRVEFDPVMAARFPLLRLASQRFRTADAGNQEKFQAFCQNKSLWLEDYALFMALKAENQGQSWNQWDGALAKRNPDALKQSASRLAEEVYFHKFLQFEFFRQWSEIKNYANERQIAIIGDIPIYVAHDSADVWARPENFVLDVRTGEPAMMAGVPPDYFSATGQLWGNPVYNWGQLHRTQFKWWVQRFHALLDYVDIIRIDHFRGFEAFWAVPKGQTTAMKGKWVKALGTEFFETLRQELGELPILAEDLGVITPEVEALRDRFQFPGMRVLHFAFGSDPANPFLPFNYNRNCVVYTGTHDNDTTKGWFKTLNDYERNNLLNYAGELTEETVNWALIRLAMSSIANIAILPLQDILGLDTDARMNRPSIAEGNWNWRYRAEALTPDVQNRLATLTWLFGRQPPPLPG